MNASTPVIRLSLFALTGAMILGAATLHPRTEQAAAAMIPTATSTAALSTVTLPTITVRPSADEIAAANAIADKALPTLPTVYVSASEEEMLAALIDPTDQIQIMSTITASTPERERNPAAAAAMQPMLGDVSANADEDSGNAFGAVLSEGDIAASPPAPGHALLFVRQSARARTQELNMFGTEQGRWTEQGRSDQGFA